MYFLYLNIFVCHPRCFIYEAYTGIKRHVRITNRVKSKMHHNGMDTDDDAYDE